MKHASDYFSQIQLAMGLSSSIPFCDFVVNAFNGLIIIRTKFD